MARRPWRCQLLPKSCRPTTASPRRPPASRRSIRISCRATEGRGLQRSATVGDIVQAAALVDARVNAFLFAVCLRSRGDYLDTLRGNPEEMGANMAAQVSIQGGKEGLGFVLDNPP